MKVLITVQNGRIIDISSNDDDNLNVEILYLDDLDVIGAGYFSYEEAQRLLDFIGEDTYLVSKRVLNRLYEAAYD